MIRVKVRKIETMSLNLPLHVQQVVVEEDTAQKRKQNYGHVPLGGVSVAIHVNKVLHADANVTLTLMNRPNETLALIPHQVLGTQCRLGHHQHHSPKTTPQPLPSDRICKMLHKSKLIRGRT